MVKVIYLMSIKVLHLDKKQTKFWGSVFRLQIQYFDLDNKTNATDKQCNDMIS